MRTGAAPEPQAVDSDGRVIPGPTSRPLERFDALNETCAGIVDREIAVPVHRGNLCDVLNVAWKRASQGVKDEPDKRKQNAERAKQWVGELAAGFCKEYPRKYANGSRKTRHRVFWIGGKDNKKHFRRNEFLFDLMVCSVSKTESLQRPPKRLEFIDQCHWQVESEFNRSDTRELVIDMSKLVLGSAQKSYLSPRTGRVTVRNCSGFAARSRAAAPETCIWPSSRTPTIGRRSLTAVVSNRKTRRCTSGWQAIG